MAAVIEYYVESATVSVVLMTIFINIIRSSMLLSKKYCDSGFKVTIIIPYYGIHGFSKPNN